MINFADKKTLETASDLKDLFNDFTKDEKSIETSWQFPHLNNIDLNPTSSVNAWMATDSLKKHLIPLLSARYNESNQNKKELFVLTAIDNIKSSPKHTKQILFSVLNSVLKMDGIQSHLFFSSKARKILFNVLSDIDKKSLKEFDITNILGIHRYQRLVELKVNQVYKTK